ncbi:hypothetical protein FPSE_10935 [Fusarium pseudograminearum CS3096]|uniref:Uncharacterized protein n=3 Tax=Fusarium pseudograminearum TaxID=101028 RepID=K3V9Y8_FUSPC|nr:hypothetical protein FPSE_10935 [Fusarium pseudograminearum CS3096]EKJ68873.1 hypothetical protein FPSE_10935 [Fusarium pseudograminearum CS3096]KAF0635653.1 hypothetical protein FPSE5266_10935 [Fusarium pseudograminearum]CEG02273.1 unnamed protein product [Fusarium pseudograminearum CS3220]CEG02397.1 unnamed protein product [Fusarium pseudograminearum CS3427]
MWEDEWAAAPEGTWVPDDIFLPRDEAFWLAPNPYIDTQTGCWSCGLAPTGATLATRVERRRRRHAAATAAATPPRTWEERVAAVVAACKSRLAAMPEEYQAQIRAADEASGLDGVA